MWENDEREAMAPTSAALLMIASTVAYGPAQTDATTRVRPASTAGQAGPAMSAARTAGTTELAARPGLRTCYDDTCKVTLTS
ncbi:hypothetical protein Nocox_02625 [Nonomuraea coxensis DSM 45129]|uniref:Uncharacterized protein n=2 Tax=Nonomuraea coxensis TaxID=404386 RepID=A0ABX8TTS3_9ACTN|nr:hypothetical protein Nocox_02625 [Nonomuraea coxensis DSM 45129]